MLGSCHPSMGITEPPPAAPQIWFAQCRSDPKDTVHKGQCCHTHPTHLVQRTPSDILAPCLFAGRAFPCRLEPCTSLPLPDLQSHRMHSRTTSRAHAAASTGSHIPRILRSIQALFRAFPLVPPAPLVSSHSQTMLNDDDDNKGTWAWWPRVAQGTAVPQARDIT